MTFFFLAGPCGGTVISTIISTVISTVIGTVISTVIGSLTFFFRAGPCIVYRNYLSVQRLTRRAVYMSRRYIILYTVSFPSRVSTDA